MARAEPSGAHSVHVEIDGLRPASWYFYRFRAGGAVSPVGRTRTAPAGAADRLRLAVAAYQAYYEHLPLRLAQRPTGPDLRLYRHLAFGDLAALRLLDTRHYRTEQPCGG